MVCLKNQIKAIPRAQHISIAVYNSKILKTHCGAFRSFVELVARHRKLMDFAVQPLFITSERALSTTR
jgi:hypothetical protein